MKVPEQIRALRREKGFTERELAAKLGIDLPSYYDLEEHSDEWDFVLSIREFKNLARILGVSPLFLAGETKDKSIKEENFQELRNMTEVWMKQGNRKEDLSWEIDEILKDPSVADQNPVIFLKDLGNDIGFDWRSFLHDSKAQQVAAGNVR